MYKSSKEVKDHDNSSWEGHHPENKNNKWFLLKQYPKLFSQGLVFCLLVLYLRQQAISWKPNFETQVGQDATIGTSKLSNDRGPKLESRLWSVVVITVV